MSGAATEKTGQTHEAEPGTDVVVVPYKPQIAEYSTTAAELAKLEAEFKGVIYPVTTPKGMAEAKAARWHFVKLRTGLDKIHREVKASVLERTRLIDGEKREILKRIEPLEKGIADQIDAEEKRIEAEKLAKEQAERDRAAAEEKARKDAEEKVAAAQRAELERQREELAKQQAAQREADRLAEENRQKILADIKREQDEAKAKAEREAAARSEIIAIQQQSIVAQQGKLGLRVGGTIECIRETLAETEAWQITDEKFGWLAEQAQQVKTSTVQIIRSMLVHAEQQKAEQDRIRADEERIAAERRKIEDDQRKAREEQEARDRAERDAKEAAERKAREDALAKELEDKRQAEEAERAKRQAEAEAQAKREAEEREQQRAAQELLDADAMLATFKDRFGHLPKYAPVIKAIDKIASGR